MAVKKRYRELPEEEDDLNEKPPAKQKHPKEVASLQVSDLHAAKWDLNVTLQSSTTHDEEADCRTRHCHYRHLGTDDCIVGIDCMSGWVELVAQTLPLLRSLLISNARTFRA